MRLSSRTWTGRRILRGLAGLQAGVLGGIAMLAWFAASAVAHSQYWFATPNVLASTFFGEAVFRAGAGFMTVAGSALHIVMAGTAGFLFGIAVPETRATRMALMGFAAGLLWYWIAFGLIWPALNPLVPLYTPRTTALIAHGILGLSFAQLPLSAKTLE